MPSTIPYDPSLVLGNIVTKAKLDVVTEISKLQAPIDAAEAELNSLISTKRSLDMTVEELLNMEVDATEVIAASKAVGESIKAAAIAYAKVKVMNETKIQPLQAKISEVHESLESPVDYNKTEIKNMPLSADSLKMNVQYFSLDTNMQASGTYASTISNFVSGETEVLGGSVQMQASSSAQSQVNSQISKHDIAGTLVVSIVCTHKSAALLAPFVLDVDKGIRVWNRMHPTDMIKTNSVSSMAGTAALQDTLAEKSISIISGATYGSCFIGMVHILNTTDTMSNEVMFSVAESMQAQFDIGSWFAHESGGFGVDSSFSGDVKNLLSSQNVTSHCSLITMGSIPSIKSNEVQIGVQSFSDFDGASSMAALQKIQNATASEQQTIGEAASAARTGSQMIALQNANVEAALSALAKIDDGQNKILDINSMMDALEDYVNKCLDGNVGVPINYYIKPITKSQLAQMWVAKYYPGRYVTSAGDDTTPKEPASSTDSGGDEG